MKEAQKLPKLEINDDVLIRFIIVIKLMSKEFRMERELAHLGEQDFKKLFPQEYFNKYAEHLNILKFEQTLFADTHTNKGHQGFISRKRVASMGTLHPPGKVRLNKYDPVGDTIAKNKLEAVRMQKFTRQLNQKIKEGPTKTAMTIRTPLVGYGDVPDEVFDKMRLIQNEQYEQSLQKQRQKRKNDDEYVKFKMRNHSTSPSKFSLRMERSQSIMADSAQSHSIRDYKQHTNISNTMQLHPIIVTPPLKEETQLDKQGSRSLTYQQRLQKLMLQARSQVVGLNPQDRNVDVRYIMAMNRSIRKIKCLQDEIRSEKRKRTVANWQTQAMSKSRGQLEEKKEKKRKNLIEMTENIRKEGERIQLLSRYQELMKQRQFKQFLLKKQAKIQTLLKGQSKQLQ